MLLEGKSICFYYLPLRLLELVGADVKMIGTPEIARLMDNWWKRSVQGMTKSSISVQLFLRSVRNHHFSLHARSTVINSLAKQQF